MRICHLVHPDDLPGGQKGLESPLPAGRWELRWLTRDGTTRWCSTSVWLVTDPAGQPTFRDEAGRPKYWIHQLEDVSDRHELTFELSRAERRFSAVLERISDYAIFRLDAEGNVASWNAGAERIKGYSAEEIIGRHYRVFFPPEGVAAGAPDTNLGQARANGQASGEGWRRRKDGTNFWAAWTLIALTDEEGELEGYLKITRDMTPHFEASARIGEYAGELERAYQQLKQASKLRDDLLAVAHHEFRTPITAIIGFADALRSGWARLSDTDRDTALAAMASAGRRLGGLLDNLTTLSSLYSEDYRTPPEPVRLAGAVIDAADMAGVDLEGVAVDVDNSLEVLGDPARVRQIIANLLTNASIYGGGPTEVRAGVDRAQVVLEVVDAGPGVPAEFVPQLFERFSQASRGATRTAKGTGLGLAVVRELARAYGGDVSYRPNTPTGARFAVRLPAKPY